MMANSSEIPFGIRARPCWYTQQSGAKATRRGLESALSWQLVGKMNLCQIHLPLTISNRMTISHTPFSRCFHGVSNQWWVVGVEYTWNIRGIYVEYTWNIRGIVYVEYTWNIRGQNFHYTCNFSGSRYSVLDLDTPPWYTVSLYQPQTILQTDTTIVVFPWQCTSI